MQMWVFRVTRGWGGGTPEGVCPIGLDSDIILKKIAAINPTPLTYDGDEVILYLMNYLSIIG